MVADGAGDQVWAARCMLRAARVGTLATLGAGGAFASLVTPATAPDGSVLLLLSDLAEHTKHLRADPRCSLLVAGIAADANPQTTPRLTLVGHAALEQNADLLARYIAVHPYAALYAGFGDFNLWRIRAEHGLFVGGFARAAKLAAAQITAPDWRIAAPGCAAADADGYDVPETDRTCRIAWQDRCESLEILQDRLGCLGGGRI